MPTLPGHGAVAVHRWFAHGEDWAYHPWFYAHRQDLLRALDRQLKVAGEGPFAVPALGGVLVGEKAADPDCPDPKARDRRPTVLRVAYLAAPLPEAEHLRFLQTLRQTPLPTRSGQDDALALLGPVPEAPAPTLPRESPAPPPARGRPALRVALAVALALGATLTWWFLKDPAPSRGPGSGNWHKPVGSSLREDPVIPGSDPLTPEILNASAIRKLLGAYARADHPYVAYLQHVARHLPEAAAPALDERQIQDGLFEVYQRLQPAAGRQTLPLLREALRRELSYDDWRKRAGNRDYADAAKPLPEGIRRLVEEFRAAGPFREPAEEMADLLRAWGERDWSRGYASRRPFAVIDRFFALLTRPRHLPRPLDLDHPQAAFLWRLPADPVGEGLTYESEEELRAQLRHLLQALSREADSARGGLGARDLVRQVGLEMDYPKWRQSAGRRTFVHEGRDPGPEVGAWIRRFSRAGAE